MDIIRKVHEEYNFAYAFKPEQLAIIKNVLDKKHTCGILPTGFGKSDCFVVPQLVLDEVSFSLLPFQWKFQGWKNDTLVQDLSLSFV